MDFETHSIISYLPIIYAYAVKFKYSIYDISYAVLAEQRKIDFVTGDERFFNATKEHFNFVYHLSTFRL